MHSTDENIRLDLRALVYPEDGVWIAHCLELDLPAEGESPQEAIQSLMDLMVFQVTTAMEDGDLASLFSPAPAEIWRLYTLAQDSDPAVTLRPSIGRPVNRLEIREYAVS